VAGEAARGVAGWRVRRGLRPERHICDVEIDPPHPEDEEGEVRWEVIETAERMGYSLDDHAMARLHAAADAYRRQMAAQMTTELPAGSATSEPPAQGTRIELIRTTDEHTRLLPGTTGTVSLVDGAGTVHVRWDDGSTLGLIPGLDDWKELL
jgi:hypothetical protein